MRDNARAQGHRPFFRVVFLRTRVQGKVSRPRGNASKALGLRGLRGLGLTSYGGYGSKTSKGYEVYET